MSPVQRVKRDGGKDLNKKPRETKLRARRAGIRKTGGRILLACLAFASQYKVSADNFDQSIDALSAQQIIRDARLSSQLSRTTKPLFQQFCAECHSVDGKGINGNPDLTDADWLHGGEISDILTSITRGRGVDRHTNRPMAGGGGIMTAHVAGGILSDAEAHQMARWIVGMKEDGKPMHWDSEANQWFLSKGCIACHGADARGVDAMGAANLRIPVWRFRPGGKQSAYYTIAHGVNDPADPRTRQAHMPDFDGYLSPGEIKKLAAYVFNLAKQPYKPSNLAGYRSARDENRVIRSGKQIYESACLACHLTGAANAPKLGNQTAWEPRIAKGKRALLRSALDGIAGTAMPPRGTCSDCSALEVRNALDYMVAAGDGWKLTPGPSINSTTTLSLKRTDIREIQRRLTRLGYNPGPTDGLMGAKTRDAIQLFQLDSGLPVDGEATITLLERLRSRASQSRSIARPTRPEASKVTDDLGDLNDPARVGLRHVGLGGRHLLMQGRDTRPKQEQSGGNRPGCKPV